MWEILKKVNIDRQKLIIILGIAALALILVSAIIPKNSRQQPAPEQEEFSAEEFCARTEQRLEEFLEDIDGVGRVKVMINVAGSQKYIYASEGRQSRSENKSEEETKYVMIGSGSDKSALVETVRSPEITGVVVACTGDSPQVREQVYRTAAAALGIQTSKIYVTKMK